jgi:hypothetical protein
VSAALARNDAAVWADPLEVLEARCWARAWLWASCDILDLLDAVDGLQEFAVRCGLVDTIGQDAVQSMISDAFRPYRGGINAA